jgi:hypothetical protein
MIKLLIEDSEVDVLQTERIVGEYAIAPIGNISKKVGARSITFKLPKTAKNRAVFESAEVPTSLSIKPYRRLKARLYVDGVDMNMLFFTLERVTDFYEGRVYGSNANFFNFIKDRKLADLDLTAFNHHWDNDFVAQSLPTDYPIKYALIDFNIDSPNLAINNINSKIFLGTMLPSVNEHYLIEKICNEAGFSLVNKTANETFFDDYQPFIPCGGGSYERDDNLDRLKGSFYLLPIPTGSSSGLFYFSKEIISQTQSYWQQYPNSNTNFGGAFTIPDNCIITYELNINLYNDGASAEQILIDVYSTSDLSGDVLVRTYNILVPVTGFPSTPFVFTDTNTVTCIIPNSGNSKFYFIVRSSTFTNVFNFLEDNLLTIKNVDKYNGDYDKSIVYEMGTDAFVYNYITVANNLPPLTQAAFFKAYLQKFNSVVTVDEKTKRVFITPFKELKSNISKAVNWSGKLDHMKENITSFTLDYGQQNTFKYKDYEDILKPFGTDYRFDIDDQNLPFEETIVELPYSATETVERLGGFIIPKINKFEIGLPSLKFNPRCLLIRYESGSFTYLRNILNSTDELTITTDIPFAHFISEDETSNLGFGVNLWGVFFFFLEPILDRTKVIECLIRLNTSDIATFDFLRPVYIKELDGYFYVSKIKFEYTSNASSVCELVKLL